MQSVLMPDNVLIVTDDDTGPVLKHSKLSKMLVSKLFPNVKDIFENKMYKKIQRVHCTSF
jgi:hypothetical protein